MVYSDGMNNVVTTPKFDTRMQISISKSVKNKINQLKPKNMSLSGVVRHALQHWIEENETKKQHFKQVFKKITTASKSEKKITNKQVDKWLRSIRQDRPIDY